MWSFTYWQLLYKQVIYGNDWGGFAYISGWAPQRLPCVPVHLASWCTRCCRYRRCWWHCLYIEIDIYEREVTIYVFLFYLLGLLFNVPLVSIYTCNGGGKPLPGLVFFFFTLHIALLRSGPDAFVLDAARQNSWTFVAVQLFAVSCLLLRTWWTRYLKMETYRYAVHLLCLTDPDLAFNSLVGTVLFLHWTYVFIALCRFLCLLSAQYRVSRFQS